MLPSNVTNKMPLDRPAQFQSNNASSMGGHFKSNLVSSIARINLKAKDSAFPFVALEPSEMGAHVPMVTNVQTTEANSDMLPNASTSDLDSFQHGNLDGMGDILLPGGSDPMMKSSPITDYLSVSPIFGPWSLTFDNKMFEETTPDEFAPINFLKGISNINYDFISDNSGENSISEDVGGGDDVQANPSNTDSNNETMVKSDSTSSFNLDEFDPLRSGDIAAAASTASSTQSKPTNIVLIDPKPTTLIESEDSPNQVLLPSPLKPTATDYKGFSNSKIPSISCNTGDFSSSDVNYHQS